MIMRWCLLILFLWMFFSDVHAYAQDDAEALFTADIGSPFIGQPLDLLLTVKVPDGTVVNFPEFPTDWPPLMIQNIAEVATTTSNGITIYSQHLTILLWQTGEYQTPETLIEYQLPNSTDQQLITVQPAYFDVKSVLDADDLNLRPLKPQLAMFYVSPLMGAAILLGLGVIGAFVWSKRKQINFSRVNVNTGNLHPAAQAVLSEIKRLGSGNNISPSTYVVVSDALRRYLQGRFGVHASDMTSQELIVELSTGQDLSERRQRELANLLEQADLVKFAAMQPPSKSTDKLLNVAYGWVIAVEQESLEVGE